MLKTIRQRIIHHLWENYKRRSAQMMHLEKILIDKGIHPLPLDHFAIIDLPSPHSGIPQLSRLFSLIGYVEQGRDYLPEKQNGFVWMTEMDSTEQIATNVLPQAVVADFCLDDLPQEIKIIIEKYARLTQALPEKELTMLVEKSSRGDLIAGNQLCQLIIHYLSGRDWPLPTMNEYRIVQEWNELLAWVLLFGRKPNHFTLSIHLLDVFSDIHLFHDFIENEAKLISNKQGGAIKGSIEQGISQGSTQGTAEIFTLADGCVSIPGDFVEFVWRYPVNKIKTPVMWQDYFNGFIAKQATHVIESLFIPTIP